MPSVKSRFDLNPPLPRMLINDSELAVAAKTLFLSRTSESFKEYLNTKTVEPLKLLMGQMVSIDGRERFTRTQSKLQRIASIIDWCTGFLLFFSSTVGAGTAAVYGSCSQKSVSLCCRT